MIVCQSCNAEIIRPEIPPTTNVSHGLCLECFIAVFGDVEGQSLRHLASNAIEQLPMGTILLDEELRVAGYNQAESRLTGLRSDQVIGRLFFVEIAPCMAAPSVGAWCATQINSPSIQRKEVEWALSLRDGRRLASLVILAGRGRAAITITLAPLETDPDARARFG